MPDTRIPRCLRLVVDEHTGVTDRCTAERCEASDLCQHHLAQAVLEWKAIRDRFVTGRMPPLTPAEITRTKTLLDDDVNRRSV